MQDEHFHEIMMLSDFLASTLLKYRKFPLFAKSIDDAVDYALKFHGDCGDKKADDFIQSVQLSSSFYDLAKAYCDAWHKTDEE